MSVLLIGSFSAVMFTRFLKVVIATSNLLNEVYNDEFEPNFNVSILKKKKKISTVVPSYVFETWKKS